MSLSMRVTCDVRRVACDGKACVSVRAPESDRACAGCGARLEHLVGRGRGSADAIAATPLLLIEGLLVEFHSVFGI